MNRLSTGLFLTAALFVTLSYNACTKGGFEAKSLAPSTLNLGSSAPRGSSGGIVAFDGKALYAKNCATCHSSLDVSTKKDRTFEQINTALAGIPSMAGVKGLLSAAEIQAIATALQTMGPAPDGSACVVSSVGNSMIRRLNRSELQNALVDLLGVNQNFVAGMDADSPGPSGFTNDAKGLTIGYVQLGKMMTAIETAVNAALAVPNSALLKCTNNLQDATCARSQLQAFARKAYRHTPTAAEMNTLMGVYTANQADGFSKALGLALQTALLSPNFMHVTAFSGPASANGIALSQQEFATRLALFLWNSVPDTRLLDLADQGTLQQAATLKSEITRMLADAKAQRFIDNIFKEWLHYDKVADATVILRTGITAQLRTDMTGETSTFLRSLFAEDKSLMTMVTADYSYLNANMASHYGIAGVSGTNFQKISLGNTGRKGILSQASMMTVLANQGESRPVARGHFLLDQILCSPPPPPPPNVDTGALNNVDKTNLTVRELMALHASNPTCASCHSAMDPLGLSFENFNQLGQYRTNYNNGRPVDATGTVFQKSFNNFSEMSTILAQQSKVRSCLASKVLTYAINRLANNDENCVANKVAAVAVQDSSKMSDLIFQIVTNDMFNFNITDSK
jgi:hypothetical protein